MLNYNTIITAAEYIARHCTNIADTMHGRVWLADKLIRAFESSPATEAITFNVYLQAPVFCDGEATVHRDGNVELKRKESV